MMGKLPPWVIILIGLVLVIGISVGAFLKFIKPANAVLAAVQADLQTQKQKAETKPAVEQQLAEVTDEWLAAERKLDRVKETRSIRISYGHPFNAMAAALWPELRGNLAKAIEEWIEGQGVKIVSGASLPPPPYTPELPPENGFFKAADITLGVEGSLANIEKLYRSLSKFPRIATINSLSLTSQGDTIQAQLPLTIYLLVETSAVSPGAGAVGGMGGVGAAGGMAPGPGGAMGGPGGATGGPGGMAGGPGGRPAGPGGAGGAPSGTLKPEVP